MMERYIKVGGAAITGLVASYFKAYGIIFVFVGIAIVFDVVTGLIASASTGEPITSAKASKGFWRKIALLMALCLGVFLDFFISQLANVVSIDFKFEMPFALIIGCYIVLNELISICENIFKTNAISMPKWIKKMLVGYKKEIDDMNKEEKK